MSLPLVTCIVPTANRRAFLPRAIELFMAQDYPNKQLVIVEDGDDLCCDLIPADPAIDYVHIDGPKRTIGEKRNIACERAAGELIAHWDDDDWHAPNRLSVEVAALKSQGARLCGLSRLVLYDPTRKGGKAWLYESIRPRVTGIPYLVGGTLVYEKSLWEEQPFTHVRNGEDTAFVDAAHGRGVSIAAVSDESLYVALIHNGNTAKKKPDAQWGGYDVEVVRRRIGENFVENGRAA